VHSLSNLMVHGHQNYRIYFIHFVKAAELSDNFDSNVNAQCFVNTEKLTFYVDDLQT